MAPATAQGPGAIAIVRLSGTLAHTIATGRFTARSTREPAPGLLRLGTLRDASGAAIDECLLVLWRGPESATGEDVAEFHLHGSPAIVDATLAALVGGGARLAEPGEFTRRAFLNGRIDLSQAEAIGALTRARTDAARRAALAQMSGGLAVRAAALRAKLVPVLAQLDALVDYPEDVNGSLAQTLSSAIATAQGELSALQRGATRGRLLAEGARVVLSGPPNAGKSSLFNVLLGRERAIVSPHPGTTRDTIEATVEIGGVATTLVDTAGVRETQEAIEAAGVARSLEELESADLVLLLTVAAEPAPVSGLPKGPFILIRGKADLGIVPATGPAVVAAKAVVEVSSVTRAGIESLEAAMVRALAGGDSSDAPPAVFSARQATTLAAAAEHLARAREGLASELSPEFVSLSVTEAISALDAVAPRADNRPLDEEVLDAVFSTFCLGK